MVPVIPLASSETSAGVPANGVALNNQVCKALSMCKMDPPQDSDSIDAIGQCPTYGRTGMKRA
jgi:hypothetical protein